ncbi:MAG: putative RDD family membrane protein YckC [Rhodothermales bacterium]
MEWYYELNGERIGPLDEDGLRVAAANGVVGDSTLVWNESLPDWTPYSDVQVVAPTQVEAQHQVSHGARQDCEECGQAFPEDMMLAYEDNFICASCKPVFLQKIRQGVDVGGAVENGGMGRRLVAQWVDGFLLALGGMLIQFLFGLVIAAILTTEDPSSLMIATFGGMFLVYLMSAAYEGFFLSRTGSTPGKSVLGVKVVRSDGSLVSFWRGFGRYFARVLVSLPLGIGLLAAFFDEQQRGWHDRMCDTRVIRNS